MNESSAEDRRNEIEQARTTNGGWTKATLAAWGVVWPPPKGWKEDAIKSGFPRER